MKNKTITSWQFLYIILISVFFPNILFAQPLVAVGSWSEKGVNRPLVAVSQDLGSTWFYPLSANQQPLSSNFFRGELNKIACNQKICVAAGNWMDKSAVFRPLLSFSVDDGNTWNYLDMLHEELMLPGISSSKFKDITCTKHFCLAVGWFTDTDKRIFPLVARGDYQSECSLRFITKNIQPHLPDNFHKGQFNKVICHKNVCLAAGIYFNLKGRQLPLLMHSDKTGQHWKKSILNFPANFHEGNVQGIYCDESLCFVVGEYQEGNDTKPLLMMSSDQGKTWDSSVVPMPVNYGKGTLAQISCAKGWCTAAGALIQDYKSWPYLIYSDDAGKHWHCSDYISNDGLPETFFSGQLVYTACNADMCIAAGSYESQAGGHPLLAVSTDKGKTWRYSSSAQKSSPLALDEDGLYTHAFCNDLLCLATGEFLDTKGIVSPLLVLREKKGKHWHYPESVSTHLPAGLQNAHFFGVG